MDQTEYYRPFNGVIRQRFISEWIRTLSNWLHPNLMPRQTLGYAHPNINGHAVFWLHVAMPNTNMYVVYMYMYTVHVPIQHRHSCQMTPAEVEVTKHKIKRRTTVGHLRTFRVVLLVFSGQKVTRVTWIWFIWIQAPVSDICMWPYMGGS